MEEALVEIEALRSIFEDELVVEEQAGGSKITVQKKVRPNDEGGVSSASVVVHFTLGEGYPSSTPPLVRLSNPRGISDSAHSEMERAVAERLKETEGMPVVYEILTLCSDLLLSHQHSDSLDCPICLCPLSSSAISSTPCDHYTHTQCLAEHTRHTRQQLGEKLKSTPAHMQHEVVRSLLCPVCREVIDDEVDPIYPPAAMTSSAQKKRRSRRKSENHNQQKSTPTRPTTKDEQQFDFDWKSWRERQTELQAIYLRQQEKGGIIDLEEERKRNLITEHTVVVVATAAEEDNSSSAGAPIRPGAPPGLNDVIMGGPPPGFEGRTPAVNNNNNNNTNKGTRNNNRGRGRPSGHHGSRGRGGASRPSNQTATNQSAVATATQPTKTSTEASATSTNSSAASRGSRNNNNRNRRHNNNNSNANSSNNSNVARLSVNPTSSVNKCHSTVVSSDTVAKKPPVLSKASE